MMAFTEHLNCIVFEYNMLNTLANDPFLKVEEKQKTWQNQGNAGLRL